MFFFFFTALIVFTNLQSDFLFKRKPKLNAQFAAAEKDEVPFVIMLGEEELRTGHVTIKEQQWELVDGKKVKLPNDGKGETVRRDELVAWIKRRT